MKRVVVLAVAVLSLLGVVVDATSAPWWLGATVKPGIGTPPPGVWTRKAGTLATDINGWAMGPDIAVDTSGDLYAVWQQDYIASNGTRAEGRVKKYTGGAWGSLGGGFSFSVTPTGLGGGGDLPVSQPRIALLGTTPYIVWQESSGYFSSIHVAHFDGNTWVHDAGPGADGAVVDKLTNSYAVVHPAIANVGGVITIAYYFDRSADAIAGQIKVKALSGGVWVDEATIAGITPYPDMVMSLDLRVGTSNPWLMIARHHGTRSLAVLERTAPGTWVQRGGDLRNSSSNIAPNAALAVLGNTPYVALAEGAIGGPIGELGGPHQIFVKHWNGSSWAADGAANNVNTGKHAGRPAIATDGTNVWIAWVEGSRGEKTKLYSRKLTVATSTWETTDGPLNADQSFSADGPRLVARGGIANVIWGERASGSTKQIYVAGTDAATASSPAAPSGFGINGSKPTLLDNQWQYLNPAKGIASVTSEIHDESFNSTLYSPGLNKTLLFGHYHIGTNSSGEQQNALLAYDFTGHRLDLLDVADGTYTENLHGHGHTEGNACYDSLHDILIARGTKVLQGELSYLMYEYDPIAGRGKRVMPLSADDGGDGKICAFDRTRDRALIWETSSGNIYDPHANAVVATVALPAGVSRLANPGITYDHLRDLFIMFGGATDDGGVNNFNSVWTLPAGNPGAGWTLRTTSGTPPSPRMNPNVAFDTLNGVVMVMGGYMTDGNPNNQKPGPLDSFILDPATWAWTSAGTVPWVNAGGLNAGGTGNMMVYDSSALAFLLRDNSSIENWYRYKFVGAGFTIPTRTWVARSMVNRPRPPGAWCMGFQVGCKHSQMAQRTTDNRMYGFGGDWYDYAGFAVGMGGDGDMGLWSVDLRDDTSWRQEWPIDGTWRIPLGEVGPNMPDEGAFVYDAARDRFLAFEAFWFGNYSTPTVTVVSDAANTASRFRIANVFTNGGLGFAINQKFRFLSGALVGQADRVVVNIETAPGIDGFITINTAYPSAPVGGDTAKSAIFLDNTGTPFRGQGIYSPTARQWSLPPWPSPGPSGDSNGPRGAVWDPVTDQVFLFKTGQTVRILHLSGPLVNTWETVIAPFGTQWEYDKAMIDVTGRAAYAVDTAGKRIIKMNLDTRAFTIITPPSATSKIFPTDINPAWSDLNNVVWSFDSHPQNRVLLFVTILNNLSDDKAYAFNSYKVDTGVWTNEGIVQPGTGGPIHGNQLYYDAANNIHMLIGQGSNSDGDIPFYYLYRYGP